MTKKSVTTLAFAALALAALAGSPVANAQDLVTNGPKASRGDFGDWSAARNVMESRHYDRLLEVSPGFRHYRMRKECGPINDPQLRSNCLASFDQFEPRGMYGSSSYINPPYSAGQ
jgi:hypothetical protein